MCAAVTNPRVLCLGEILFDLLADQLGRSLEQVESWTPYPGGAPANVACALVKLGTQAGFIGCVGSDEAGDTLVDLLQDVGVDSTGVQRHPTAPTGVSFVTHSEAGHKFDYLRKNSAASLMTCEPVMMRPQWGAFGRAAPALSACFVHPLAIEEGLGQTLGLSKALLPARGTRTLTKQDMLHNSACPDIRVDPDVQRFMLSRSDANRTG